MNESQMTKDQSPLDEAEVPHVMIIEPMKEADPTASVDGNNDGKTSNKSPEKKGFSTLLRSLSTKVFIQGKSDEDNDSKKEERSAGGKRSQEETDRLIAKLKAEMNKPYHYHYWVRSLDRTGTIYYYNTMTGETSWLPVCSVCAMTSDKWCLQCNAAFCQKHLIKKHNPKPSTKLPPITNGSTNNNSGGKKSKKVSADDNSSLASSLDNSELLTHQYSDVELPADPNIPIRPPRMENEEYCLECQLNIAEILCGDCWDAFCNDCFRKVHRVGVLRNHKPLPYQEAKASWYTVRGQNGEADFYVNGSTGETTFEKPRELMNDLERKFYDNWQTNQAAAEELTEMIGQLQFDIEKAKFEKDKMLFEMNEMSANYKVKANTNTSGVDIEALFAQSTGNQSEYRQILLNPSDRKRGQARTQYIKNLLEAPFPS